MERTLTVVGEQMKESNSASVCDQMSMVIVLLHVKCLYTARAKFAICFHVQPNRIN